MKIASVNMMPYGSTGKIMLQIASLARAKGHDAITFSTFPYDKNVIDSVPDIENHFTFGQREENKRHYYLALATGKNGCFSRKGTKKLIKKLREYNPDILHLHNLHKFCVNIPMLFKYIKSCPDLKVVWTLHDCWSFTGHCAYFDMAGCDKWKTGCGGCLVLSDYPRTLMDNTKTMYKSKKKWFTGISNMTLITPSEWLAGLVKESFLKDYPVRVINNGIDLSVFKPTDSNLREKLSISEKKVILGVAFDWGNRKGLDVFVELSKRLPEDIKIVLVGTDENVDAELPENIISIRNTKNQEELAKVYAMADLFVNPTREDNYPTVNMESIASGTPVITFATGGSPEILTEDTGAVVPKDDIDKLEEEILRILKEEPFDENTLLKRAETFDMNRKFSEYIDLYESL